MSLYDGMELMSIRAAAREFDVPVKTLELAVSQGALTVIEREGAKWLRGRDVEQFVKRTIKQGAGNKVITRVLG
ncbi:MAG: helix-turn-helix domain-containing protein [Blastocatellia bacterium]